MNCSAVVGIDHTDHPFDVWILVLGEGPYGYSNSAVPVLDPVNKSNAKHLRCLVVYIYERMPDPFLMAPKTRDLLR